VSDYEFESVARFTAGAVGEPGQRVFHLQVVAEGQLVTVKVEKGQIAALARYFADLLADLPAPAPTDIPDEMDLVEPAVDEWVVGQLSVARDETIDGFVVRAEELIGEEDEDGVIHAVEGGSLRVNLSIGQVHAFIVRIAQLLASGRPPCPVCGQPLDPEGHMCAKTNGHKPS
jgi:uncharacterized repeat protein (TIGR03847 family)